MLFEGCNEVVEVCFFDPFDAQIIDYKYELDVSCLVFPQPRYKFALEVSLSI
jgi:hypothetical protein